MFAREVPVSFSKKHDGWLKILPGSKNSFLVSENDLELIEKNKTTQKLSFSFKCNDAVLFQNNILLATDTGIKMVNTASYTLQDMLPEKISKKVTHITVDALGNIWFAKEFEGCFMIEKENIVTKVTAPVIYSLASTPDSNIWVGTNIGLYKVDMKNDAVQRFAEEALEGYDLPDNLIEQLYADDKSNVWVLMPDHIAFIPGKNFEGELPVYNHVGTKNNSIFSICALPNSPRAYLFATDEGIIYTPDLKADEYNHSGEIHQQIDETAFLVTSNLIDKPAEFKDEKVKLIKSEGKYTWFVTERGLWKIKTSRLEQNLHQYFTGKPAH